MLSFFDRVFKLNKSSEFKVNRTRMGWGQWIRYPWCPNALNLYGSGSLYVKLDDLVEATESEFLKSESEITAYVESINSCRRTVDNVIGTPCSMTPSTTNRALCVWESRDQLP